MHQARYGQSIAKKYSNQTDSTTSVTSNTLLPAHLHHQHASLLGQSGFGSSGGGGVFCSTRGQGFFDTNEEFQC